MGDTDRDAPRAGGVLKSVAWLQISSFLSNVSSVFLGIVVARYIGSYNYGLYSTAVVVSGLFALFADFGFSELLVREASRDEKQVGPHLGSALLAYSILSVILYVVMMEYAHIAGYSDFVIQLIAISGFSGFCARGWRIWQALFRVHQRLDLQAKLEILAALLRALLIPLVVLFQLNVFEFVVVSAVISGVVFICHILVVVRLFRLRLTTAHTLRHLIAAVPFGLSSALFFIYSQTNILVLSFMATPDATGGFAAVSRVLILASELPVIVFSSTLLPRMFKSYYEDPEELRRTCRSSLKYMLCSGVVLSFFLLAYGRTLILTIYGQGYLHATAALQILSVSVALRYLSTGLDAILTAIDRMRDKLIVQAVVAVINVILNILLVPMYSMNGAAISTVISDGILLCLFLERLMRAYSRLLRVGDLRLGRLGISITVLASAAWFGRVWLSDYVMIPALLAITPFVLRGTGFMMWRVSGWNLSVLKSE